MNWLFLIIALCFLIGFTVGIIRGAVKIAVSLLTTVITFVVVFFATPYVSKAINSVTPIQEVAETKIESMIQGMMLGAAGDSLEAMEGDPDRVRSALAAAGIGEDQLNSLGITVEDIAEGRITGEDLADMGISRNILDGAGSGEAGEAEAEETAGADIPRDMQIAAIEGADIPEVFKNLLLVNNNSAIYEKLGVTSFAAFVAKYMAKVVVNVAAFLLTLIVVTIVLRAIIFSLNVIADLPVFGFVNRLAGGALGLIGVLIVVWVVFVVITMLYTTEIGKEMFGLIESNAVLTAIYEHNPIMRLATAVQW